MSIQHSKSITNQNPSHKTRFANTRRTILSPRLPIKTCRLRRRLQNNQKRKEKRHHGNPRHLRSHQHGRQSNRPIK